MSVLNTRLQRKTERAKSVTRQGLDLPNETDHHFQELRQRGPTPTTMCNPELSRRKPGHQSSCTCPGFCHRQAACRDDGCRQLAEGPSCLLELQFLLHRRRTESIWQRCWALIRVLLASQPGTCPIDQRYPLGLPCSSPWGRPGIPCDSGL